VRAKETEISAAVRAMWLEKDFSKFTFRPTPWGPIPSLNPAGKSAVVVELQLLWNTNGNMLHFAWWLEGATVPGLQ